MARSCVDCIARIAAILIPLLGEYLLFVFLALIDVLAGENLDGRLRARAST